MTEESAVHGEIILPQDLHTEKADVIIQVEDVSRADAPSVVVSEQRQRGVQLSAGAAVAFKVEIPESNIEPNHQYSVRAHIDVSGSGEVEKGDFVTTQSYPVLTGGHGKQVQIKVKRV